MTVDRIMSKLDEYLNKNDYAGAERHLLYWLADYESKGDKRLMLAMRNELMGLYRKLGRREEALECVSSALSLIDALGAGEQVGSATVYLNCATVYKAFGMPDASLSLFEKAREIYESKLLPNDERLAGLYNNMGLTLVDLRRFDEARELYRRAVKIARGTLDEAITYLNMASAAEAEKGLIDSEAEVGEYLGIAENILENYPDRDGYYAFVCEKCASVFGYYGRFFYEKELKTRAERIYGENERS